MYEGICRDLPLRGETFPLSPCYYSSSWENGCGDFPRFLLQGNFGIKQPIIMITWQPARAPGAASATLDLEAFERGGSALAQAGFYSEGPRTRRMSCTSIKPS